MEPGKGWAITKDGGDAPIEYKEIGAFIPEQPPKEFLFDFDPIERSQE